MGIVWRIGTVSVRGESILQRQLVVSSVFVVCMSVVAPMVSAEWFMNVYLGAAFTQDEEATLSTLGDSLTTDVSFDTTVTFGGRYGHYFERLPWLGLAFDASLFMPNAEATLNNMFSSEKVDLTVVPLSFLVFLRAPGILPTSEIPHGRLQPYLAMGPALFISDVEVDLQPESGSDTSLDIGLDAPGGLGWRFDRNIGIFVEYRFTYISPEFEDTIQGVKVTAETDLMTHAALVGLSFRF